MLSRDVCIFSCRHAHPWKIAHEHHLLCNYASATKSTAKRHVVAHLDQGPVANRTTHRVRAFVS